MVAPVWPSVAALPASFAWDDVHQWEEQDILCGGVDSGCKCQSGSKLLHGYADAGRICTKSRVYQALQRRIVLGRTTTNLMTLRPDCSQSIFLPAMVSATREKIKSARSQVILEGPTNLQVACLDEPMFRPVPTGLRSIVAKCGRDNL